MTKHCLVALITLVALTGCSNRYRITLTNGNVITAKGKPKLDRQTHTYRFKDALGQPAVVPAFRVTEIAPE